MSRFGFIQIKQAAAEKQSAAALSIYRKNQRQTVASTTLSTIKTASDRLMIRTAREVCCFLAFMRFTPVVHLR